MKDIGAFRVNIDHAKSQEGTLSGLTFAVKDNYSVEGYVSGCGNPVWEESHNPEGNTSPLVESLIAAGGHLVGKTIMDELAYSLTGENVHYGTPLNTAAPDRIPGGSSSGSAACVAAELVDFALGTDTAGSVRAPASYCGLFGIRFTHGLVSSEGIVPLSKSFDCPGVLAKKPVAFTKVCEEILSNRMTGIGVPKKLVILDDAFDLVPDPTRSLFNDEIKKLSLKFSSCEHARFEVDIWSMLPDTFRGVQSYEAWRDLGTWISEHDAGFGPGVEERFEIARNSKWSFYEKSKKEQFKLAERVSEKFDEDTVLCIPTMPDVAPLKDQAEEELEVFRLHSLKLLTFASLTGRPQITFPVSQQETAPLGLSLIGFRGADIHLVNLMNDF